MAQEKPPRTTGKLTRFRQRYFPLLWFIAAADEDLLLLCPTTDQDKQAGIGMAILCTSIAACISAGYAIHSLFDSWYSALPLALFWGLIILNLDRFMVVSMRKNRKRNWLSDIGVILPRIVLALFIALLISKPLEVRIFLNQIEAAATGFRELQENKALQLRTANIGETQKQLQASDQALEKTTQVSRNSDLDPQYHQTRILYQDSQAEAQKLGNRLANLRERLAGMAEDDTRLPGLQQVAGQLRDRLQKQRASVTALKQQLDLRALAYTREQTEILGRLQGRNTQLLNSVQLKERQLKLKADTLSATIHTASRDILGQLRILDSLKAEDGGMAAADRLITGLFFLLELAPLLIKVGSYRSKYDILVAIAEQQALDDEEASIAESHQEKNIREDTAARNRGQAADIDQEVKDQVKGEILHAQAELAREIVSAWQQQEVALLKKDTQGYLHNKIRATDH